MSMSLLDELRKEEKKEGRLEDSKEEILLKKCVYELTGLKEKEKEALYKEMRRTFPLDPSKFESSYEEEVKKAEKYENRGIIKLAALWYFVALGYVFYEKTEKELVFCLNKDMMFSKRRYPMMLKYPEKTVEAARKYISKLKSD